MTAPDRIRFFGLDWSSPGTTLSLAEEIKASSIHVVQIANHIIIIIIISKKEIAVSLAEPLPNVGGGTDSQTSII